jgi:carbonic anhydrase/acetyltransferase-like protein (isoleucine patch superfamily)
VVIGAHTAVLAGAVITSEGAPVRIGERCVIMENAVLRGAGRHPCTIADHVLIGPNSHVTGATIGSGCFVATGATVFNGAVLDEGVVVAINAIVHIATRVGRATRIPIGHIAFGDPAKIYHPDDAVEVHQAMSAVGFTQTVFGFDSATLADADAVRKLLDRYTNALREHSDDRVIVP